MKYDYDLLIIGGGAAGLTASGMGANLGAKTLLVEAGKLGGDCTWHGCIPSKTLLHYSKVAHSVREAESFGLEISRHMDFNVIMNHVRQKRQEVYQEADEPEIYRQMGVDIRQGKARFADAHTVIIDGESGTQIFSARFIIIATGSQPRLPSTPGLETIPFHTNETIFELNQKPKHLVILGGGPIGIELGQAFQRLGSQVTICDQKPRILPHDDEELAEKLKDRLQKEGMDFQLSSSLQKISQTTDGKLIFSLKTGEKSIMMEGDALLVAAGRTANYDSLELDKAGIDYHEKGVIVDQRCRTNQAHVYAVGDVTGQYQFTHMSEHMAKIAVTNALLKIPQKIDTKHVPWCTYTEPELAHVGTTKAQLQKEDITYQKYRFPYSKLDRALTEGTDEGLIKVFAKKTTGKILGATIYGKHAGELISEYALAMRNGVSLRKIADTIHPYPTYGLGVRRAADQWYIKNQSSWLIKTLQWMFSYRGTVPDLSDEDRII